MVTEACINCKHTECVQMCPTDAPVSMPMVLTISAYLLRHGSVLLVLRSPYRNLLGAGARPVHPILRHGKPGLSAMHNGNCIVKQCSQRKFNDAAAADHRTNRYFQTTVSLLK